MRGSNLTSELRRSGGKQTATRRRHLAAVAVDRTAPAMARAMHLERIGMLPPYCDWLRSVVGIPLALWAVVVAGHDLHLVYQHLRYGSPEQVEMLIHDARREHVSQRVRAEYAYLLTRRAA